MARGQGRLALGFTEAELIICFRKPL
jgi:hypothetical protein